MTRFGKLEGITLPRIAPWSFFTKSLRGRLEELSKVIGTSTFFIVTMQDGFFTMVRLFHRTDGYGDDLSATRISNLAGFEIMHSTQAVIISDTKENTKGKVLYEQKIGAYMGAPILLEDGTLYGTLGTVNVIPYEFTQSEYHTMQMAADLLAYIVDLERMAVHDPLTGALNRLFLDRHSQGPTAEFGESFALLYIDLDGFKDINDVYGHESGDAVLRVIVQRLKRRLRTEDVIVRIGGDEFVVILTDLADQSSFVSSAVHRLYRSLDVEFGIGSHTFHVSVSMGVSMYPEHGRDFASLIQAADRAMYTVKKSGGKGFQIYSAELASQLEVGTERLDV